MPEQSPVLLNDFGAETFDRFSTSLPTTLRPLGAAISDSGDCPSEEIPQTIAELPEVVSYTYDLTVNLAADLQIPVVGSVGGGANRRVVVLEWKRYKAVTCSNGVVRHYGYVIRFCLTVNKWDANSQVSLPFLTAQAELGNINASWLMQVRGLAGPKIDENLLPPQDLDVDTFVIAKQSLEKLIGSVHDASTTFAPGIVVETIDPDSPESEITTSAIKAFATYSVRKGRTRTDAIGRLESADPLAADLVTEVYQFFGIEDPNEKPDSTVRAKALELLVGISADT